MNTHLTITDMMRELNISPEKYNNFKHWCYRHHEELDTRDCVWNHGYYMYNVDLVRLKCPFVAVVNADKVSTPETIETPINAAERLANAINTSTGQNLTAGDVMAAFERGKDYICMRRTMARTLWRMRKERRRAQSHSKYARNYSNSCISAAVKTASAVDTCDNLSKSCKVNAERAEKALKVVNVSLYVFLVLAMIILGTAYEMLH